MSEESEGTLHGATAGGLTAIHPEQRDEFLARVGATTGDQFNTLRASLVPVACWRVDDMRFEFDSSFVLPGIAEDVTALIKLIQEHTHQTRGRPRATIFGHADPTGNDDYNKQLSGRRATAIYGLLRRDVAVWEKLHDEPFGGDSWKAKKVTGTMLSHLGFGRSKEEVTRFQSESGTTPNGVEGPETRRALFGAYMAALCPITLQKADFLGKGKDAGGKADFQGCGEFNPIRSFSRDENAELSRKENHPRRDAVNAPNRRVMVLLFRPGVTVDPSRWPCPRAKEGVAACLKRFWSDSDKRRSFQEQRREFKATKDTFACRFYQRLAERSPCEQILSVVRIRLLDSLGKALPGAPFLILTGRRRVPGDADPNGDALVREVKVPATCEVFWSRKREDAPKPTKAEEFDFHTIVNLTLDDVAEGPEASETASKQGSIKRLHNLGYSRDSRLEENVKEFQIDAGLPITGVLEDIGEELKKRHDALVPPRRQLPTGEVRG